MSDTHATPDVPRPVPAPAYPSGQPYPQPYPQAQPPQHPYATPTLAAEPVSPSGPPPRRRRGTVAWILTVIFLSLALLSAIAAGVWFFLQLNDANATIRDKDRKIEEQRDLIDRKDTFGAAMNDLLGETASFDGIPFPSLVPWDSYDKLARDAWSNRWDAAKVDESIAAVQQAREGLVALRDSGTAEASVNASGSAYEKVFDQLGSGFVTWRLDDADTLCEGDVLACVGSEEPRIVHVDAPDNSLPYMTDWIRTGIAYHEFAHVLQFENPEQTDTALPAFSGDVETMADCFALTYLDGWALDQRVWVGSYQYWDVSLGYGYTCDESQRQVIREWRNSLGIQPRQIGPGVTA